MSTDKSIGDLKADPRELIERVDNESTKPEPGSAGAVVVKKARTQRTPCGYMPGRIRASDGTVYEVLESGQIVRRDGKMSKAERKRHKRARQAAAGKSTAEGGGATLSNATLRS